MKSRSIAAAAMASLRRAFGAVPAKAVLPSSASVWMAATMLLRQHVTAADLPCTSQVSTELTCEKLLTTAGWTACADAQAHLAVCAHCACAVEPLPDIGTACTMTCLSEYLHLIISDDQCVRACVRACACTAAPTASSANTQ